VAEVEAARDRHARELRLARDDPVEQRVRHFRGRLEAADDEARDAIAAGLVQERLQVPVELRRADVARLRVLLDEEEGALERRHPPRALQQVQRAEVAADDRALGRAARDRPRSGVADERAVLLVEEPRVVAPRR
jgi:hypothetical protein